MKRYFAIFIFTVGVFQSLFSSAALSFTHKESEARKLYVNTIISIDSGPCRLSSISIQDIRSYISKLAFEKSLSCLNILRNAAIVHKRILKEFSGTTTAFHLASEGYLKVRDIDGLIKQAKENIEISKQIAKSEEQKRKSQLLAQQSEIEIIKLILPKILSCWTPVQVIKLPNMKFKVPLYLDGQGHVRLTYGKNWSNYSRFEKSKSHKDWLWWSVANSISRAFKKAKCRNLKVPKSHYNHIKNITLTLRTRDLAKKGNYGGVIPIAIFTRPMFSKKEGEIYKYLERTLPDKLTGTGQFRIEHISKETNVFDYNFRKIGRKLRRKDVEYIIDIAVQILMNQKTSVEYTIWDIHKKEIKTGHFIVPAGERAIINSYLLQAIGTTLTPEAR